MGVKGEGSLPGRAKAERAKISFELSEAVAIACERQATLLLDQCLQWAAFGGA